MYAWCIFTLESTSCHQLSHQFFFELELHFFCEEQVCLGTHVEKHSLQICRLAEKLGPVRSGFVIIRALLVDVSSFRVGCLHLLLKMVCSLHVAKRSSQVLVTTMTTSFWRITSLDHNIGQLASGMQLNYLPGLSDLVYDVFLTKSRSFSPPVSSHVTGSNNLLTICVTTSDRRKSLLPLSRIS